MKNSIIRTNCLIALIFTIGFCLIGISGYVSFEEIFREDIESVSVLSSENIYANINSILDVPINVSLAMASDTFLRDFMMEGELAAHDPNTIKNYLSAYQKKYFFDSVFLISTKTGTYYHYKNGIDRIMTEENSENKWYYDFIRGDKDCSLNVDNDEARNNIITIFVNCKLKDGNDKPIGVVGVGLETPYIQKFLANHEKNYGVKAYLIDADGKIRLSSDSVNENDIRFDDEFFKGVKQTIAANASGTAQRWYSSNKVDGYFITRYVPNLNWYLVVEKDIEGFHREANRQLKIALFSMILVLILVISITTYVLSKYNRALIDMAEKDQLTGIRNRRSYEQEKNDYVRRIKNFRSFGIGIFDLNDLKKTNDILGHQAGDEYIKTFSLALCRAFSDCPVFRMGGDEFAVIFYDINEEKVLANYKNLKREIEICNGNKKIKMSAAFGYAFADISDPDAIDKAFMAADQNMYADKERSKNRGD